MTAKPLSDKPQPPHPNVPAPFVDRDFDDLPAKLQERVLAAIEAVKAEE